VDKDPRLALDVERRVLTVGTPITTFGGDGIPHGNFTWNDDDTISPSEDLSLALGVQSAELPTLILVERTHDLRLVIEIPENVKLYFARMAEADQAAREAEQEAEQAFDKARAVLQERQGRTHVAQRSISLFLPPTPIYPRRAGSRSRR